MRIRVLYDVYDEITDTTYKKGTIVKIDRQQALRWIREGRACFPTENRIKLPRENRSKDIARIVNDLNEMEGYGSSS